MNFLRRLFKGSEPSRPVALEGRRVYAIGDIHGCDDLLAGLIGGIEADLEPGETPLIIFLGDYVDRGPDSRGVIERLVQLRAKWPGTRFLGGNHEEAMLRFLQDMEAGLVWSTYGGKAAMRSYGVEPPEDDNDLDAWRQAHERLRAAIPDSHMRFLWSLEDSIELGDYLFVHAGVRPDRALSAQSARDLRWIREPFLSDTRRLDKIIVHGHTPKPEPHIDERRIGVDTWAYSTGVLTAVELIGEQRGFIQASRIEGVVTVSRIDVEED